MNQLMVIEDIEVKTVKKSTLPEMKKPLVDMLAKPAVCVVYNHFSLDAMLAAAIYKSNVENCVVYSSIKEIPCDIESYVIIGMRKLKKPDDILAKIFGTVKIDYPKNIKFYWVEREGHDYMSAPSLFHKIADELGVVSVEVDCLSYAACRIYEKDLTLKQLVLVYVNMMLAEASLVDSKRKFKPRSVINSDGSVRAEDMCNFTDYVKFIQSKVNGGLSTKYFRANGKTFKTIVTNISDNYFWSMRLIRLAHKYVLNMVVTDHGFLTDTNIVIEDFDFIDLQLKAYKAETF